MRLRSSCVGVILACSALVIVVRDAETAARVVAGIKKNGYDFVKVLGRLPREAYFATIRAERENGPEVVGRVPVGVTARETAEAGQASIEHLTNVLVSSSSAEPRLRELQTLQQLKVGNATQPMSATARAGARELQEKLLATYDDAKVAALFARFAKNHTWQCPTLVGLRAMYSIDDRASTSDPRLKYMPREIRQSLKPGNDPRLAGKSPVDYALDRRVFRPGRPTSMTASARLTRPRPSARSRSLATRNRWNWILAISMRWRS